MSRRWLRILLPGGLLLGLVVVVRRTVALRNEVDHVLPSPDPWTPILVPAAAAGAPTQDAWVAGGEDGSCPPTHPIKAKASSGIYHLPGMFAYARTKPDRCYADESAAEADGFTRAKR
jgi:hypothetical protein